MTVEIIVEYLLLAVAKILCRNMLYRLVNITDKVLRVSQFNFRNGNGRNDTICSARQLWERYIPTGGYNIRPVSLYSKDIKKLVFIKHGRTSIFVKMCERIITTEFSSREL